jgi:Uma2 family endonuclease
MKAVESSQKEVYTYEDYKKLPEGAPYQLIGGKLIMTAAPSTYHQTISLKLVMKLANFVADKDLGQVLYAPVDVYFGPTEANQPDIIFISKGRLDIIEAERINGAPDLVVEILSPASAYYDLKRKFRVYETQGVKEYWLVDPEEKSVAVYENEGTNFALAQEVSQEGKVSSKVLPHLELGVKDIF